MLQCLRAWKEDWIQILTLSTHMLYWSSWPDNKGAVAVQLDKMIINPYGGGLVVICCLLDRSLELCTLRVHDAIFLQ